VGFQHARVVGVSMHYNVSAGKGGSLMVAETKYIVWGSSTRLSFLGKWLSGRSVKHMKTLIGLECDRTQTLSDRM